MIDPVQASSLYRRTFACKSLARWNLDSDSQIGFDLENLASHRYISTGFEKRRVFLPRWVEVNHDEQSSDGRHQVEGTKIESCAHPRLNERLISEQNTEKCHIALTSKDARSSVLVSSRVEDADKRGGGGRRHEQKWRECGRSHTVSVSVLKRSRLI